MTFNPIDVLLEGPQRHVGALWAAIQQKLLRPLAQKQVWLLPRMVFCKARTKSDGIAALERERRADDRNIGTLFIRDRAGGIQYEGPARRLGTWPINVGGLRRDGKWIKARPRARRSQASNSNQCLKSAAPRSAASSTRNGWR
jgi:hypothetical protein